MNEGRFKPGDTVWRWKSPTDYTDFIQATVVRGPFPSKWIRGNEIRPMYDLDDKKNLPETALFASPEEAAHASIRRMKDLVPMVLNTAVSHELKAHELRDKLLENEKLLEKNIERMMEAAKSVRPQTKPE